jgi:hypothetical protein
MQSTLQSPSIQGKPLQAFELAAIIIGLSVLSPSPRQALWQPCVTEPQARVSSLPVIKMSERYPSIPMNATLWSDLRKGIHYLESSGKQLPPGFVHPGGVAYGELGLSKIAVKDVILRYPALSGISPEEVFSDSDKYELFAKYYADLLLRHYLGLEYWKLPESEVFDILQQAWFLGPTLYRAGRTVIPSRQLKAEKFIRTLSGAPSQQI